MVEATVVPLLADVLREVPSGVGGDVGELSNDGIKEGRFAAGELANLMLLLLRLPLSVGGVVEVGAPLLAVRLDELLTDIVVDGEPAEARDGEAGAGDAVPVALLPIEEADDFLARGS